ncbi:hypothetical protein [Thiocapsa bogorovii]|uniref:hypothetical protein n=1 Tax=Thiocapsa bogorovii TaxID=521689 RepID=UPI001E4882F8|nr:hypothetical protein [Thiocapsa bogorovii]UHD14395.1 hypothetical protein LT988_13880 [Thiocapsa bogorovii]
MTLHQALWLLTAEQLKQRRNLLLNGNRSTRKADMVEAISHELLSADLSQYWGRLSELEQNAVAESVHRWGGFFDRAGFKARYGSLPIAFEPPAYSYSRSDRDRRERGSLLPLFFYDGSIPEDLCKRLASIVAVPTPLEIASFADEDLPASIASASVLKPDEDVSEPLRRLATEPLIHHDLPGVLRLIGQGRITVGAKTGLPSSASMTKLETVLLGGDWYTADDDLEQPRWAGGPIRPIRPFAWPLLLQAGGLAKADGSKLVLTARGNKALSQPVEEVVSHLFARWQQKGTPDELRRVDLIKGQTAKGVRLSAVSERRAVIADAIRDCCPPGRWVAIDELFRQMQFRGRRFTVTENAWGLYFVDQNYGSLGYNGADGFEILQGRYILAYLFEYLATLGMLDVAYTSPYDARSDYGDAWGVDEFAFLSRYDGLRYIRLNALGAYSLGLAETYEPLLPKRAPLCSIGADLLLTVEREPEPAERLVLEQIAKPLSAMLWQLDPDALLRQSADPGERGRIRAFIESSTDAGLPAEVGQLLRDVEERASALADAGPARLVTCRDPAIAVMLTSDPVTAPHCTRAGERLVCVPEPKLAAFRKGLAKLGFVLPETTNG